jgi:hypothetical protein
VWNVKTEMIRVMIGAIGTISKSLQTVPQQQMVKGEIRGLQKTAILGAAHKLRKVLM